MRYLILVLIILFPSSAWCLGVCTVGVLGNNTVSGACSEYSLVSNTTISGSYWVLYSTRVAGQAFTVDGTNRSLKSLTWNVELNDLDVAESGTLTCRVGTSADLSTYITNGESSASWSYADGTGNITVTFDPMPSLSASTQYWTGCTWSESSDDQIALSRDDTGGDASNPYGIGDNWNMTSTATTRHFYLTVTTCD